MLTETVTHREVVPNLGLASLATNLEAVYRQAQAQLVDRDLLGLESVELTFGNLDDDGEFVPHVHTLDTQLALVAVRFTAVAEPEQECDCE